MSTASSRKESWPRNRLVHVADFSISLLSQKCDIDLNEFYPIGNKYFPNYTTDSRSKSESSPDPLILDLVEIIKRIHNHAEKCECCRNALLDLDKRTGIVK